MQITIDIEPYELNEALTELMKVLLKFRLLKFKVDSSHEEN